MVAVHTVWPESASVKDSVKGGLSSKKTSKYPFTSTMTGEKSMSCRHTHTHIHDNLTAERWSCALRPRLQYLRCDVTHGLADETVPPVLFQHACGWLVHLYVPLVVLKVVRPPDSPPNVLQNMASAVILKNLNQCLDKYCHAKLTQGSGSVGFRQNQTNSTWFKQNYNPFHHFSDSIIELNWV